MQGKNILDGVLIRHESVHEMHCKNMSGVAFKIEFGKAYAMVKWPFLQPSIRARGLSDKWRELIQNFVTRDSVAVEDNNNIGHYFQMKKDHDRVTHVSNII